MPVWRQTILASTMPFLLMIVGGCGAQPVVLDSAQHQALLEADRAQAEQEAVHELTLYSALERGVTRNLDARVAAIEALSARKDLTVEKLKALPQAEISGGYSGRSNKGGTSSRSVTTGQQSLEPSQSTEQHRRVASLDTTWNLLDTTLALTEARSADDRYNIARERYAKVIQNIERDVYAAYWRAWIFQQQRAQNEELIAAAGTQIERLNSAVDDNIMSADMVGDRAAQIADRVRSLRAMNEQLALAEIELKSLLSLPLESKMTLAAPEEGEDYKNLLSADINMLTWEALNARPEMREEILQRNIVRRDTLMETLRTLPGAEIFLGLNYDGNHFLEDRNWADLTAMVTQSVTNLVTLPMRKAAAQKKEEVADARRQALAAAILAQVFIARQRLQDGDGAYRDAAGSGKAALRRALAVKEKSSSGFASGEALVLSRMDAQVEMLRALMTQADVQDSYAAFMNTLGRSLRSAAAPVENAEDAS